MFRCGCYRNTRRLCVAAGLFLGLAVLPGRADAQCNHSTNRTLAGDVDIFVPTSKSVVRKSDQAAGAKQVDRFTPMPAGRKKDCIRCSHESGPAPAPIPSAPTLIDLFDSIPSWSQANQCGDEIAELEFHFHLQPVFAIEHPPRAAASR